jgi:hypothetical protein
VATDGNDGDAPGASFKVVPVGISNVVSDMYFDDEVSVEVSNTFTSLNDSVPTAEAEAEPDAQPSIPTSDFKVSNTTIDGLSAKHITTYLDEYSGTLNIYVVGSGTWEYKITANVPSYTNTPLTSILTAVLNGAIIKPAAAE